MQKKIVHFWSDEKNLTLFLVLLLVQIFVVAPHARPGGLLVVVNDILVTMIIISGLFSLRLNRGLLFFIALMAGLGVALRWSRHFFGMSGYFVTEGLLTIASLCVLLWIVLARVYREGPVTRQRIEGAVAGYVLIAFIFSIVYNTVQAAVPGSFRVDPNETSYAFAYFSLVTLTTVGYGDITAVSPLGRSLVTMEALIGQLYPAILIARLVSLSVESRDREKG